MANDEKTASMPDLTSCSPQELATFLLEQRFQGAVGETRTFLEQAQQSLSSNNDTTTATSTSQQQSTTDVLGAKLTNVPPMLVSCTVPRCGKVWLHLYERGCQAIKAPSGSPKKGAPPPDQGAVAWTAVLKNDSNQTSVEGVLLFPKPEDLKLKKKTVAPVVLWHSSSETLPLTTFKNKPYSQICCVLPAPTISKSDSDNNNDETTIAKDGLTPAVSTWVQTFCQTTTGGAPMSNLLPSSNKSRTAAAFTSYSQAGTSSTTAGLPFVSCYKGTKDGVLFPLRQGLLFWSPPVFYPRHWLHSIAAGRGSGNSRYVDVQVTLALPNDNEGEEEKKREAEGIEFTNIDRTELTGLNHFIHNVLIPEMQRDAAAAATGSHDNDADHNGKASLSEGDDNEVVIMDDGEYDESAVVVVDGDTNDDDDDDDDDDAVQVIKVKPRRQKRKASRDARQVICKRLAVQPNPQQDDEDSYDEEGDEDFANDDDNSDASDDDDYGDGGVVVVDEPKDVLDVDDDEEATASEDED